MTDRFRSPGCGWFSQRGPLYDVVISSRMRFARNLIGIRFPGRMDEAESRAVEAAITGALTARTALTPLRLSALDATERRMLVERNLVTPELAESGSGLVFFGADESSMVAVNDRDHLRISALRPGLDLDGVYAECSCLERVLDGELRFAATLDWGYLTADLSDVGTGMRVSGLLHLPALEASGALQQVVREAGGEQIRLQAFPLASGESLGAVYLVSNRGGISGDETQTREKVEDCVAALVHYERSERESLMHTRAGEVRDGVAQALEIIHESQRLSDAELFQVLSWLRLGSAVGLYDKARLQQVTVLFFAGQRAHVMRWAGLDDDGDVELVNEQRLQVVKHVLGSNR